MLEQIVKDRVACVFMPGDHDSSVEAATLNCDTFIAAETGILRLMDMGITPDVYVTDLDAPLEILNIALYTSKYILLHIHGDNIEKVISYINTVEPHKLVATTQINTINSYPLLDSFGFTDGDRAVLLPMVMGADKVIVHGYNANEPKGKRYTSPDKKLKLSLAGLLISMYALLFGYGENWIGHTIILSKMTPTHRLVKN